MCTHHALECEALPYSYRHSTMATCTLSITYSHLVSLQLIWNCTKVIAWLD